MQLVRVLEPRPRTLVSKVIESFRAMQLELRLSKEEILAAYLQFVPYGRNVEGVEAAALAYFGHRATHLSPAEIATLLAVPQNPNRRFPTPENARAAEGGARRGGAAAAGGEGAAAGAIGGQGRARGGARGGARHARAERPDAIPSGSAARGHVAPGAAARPGAAAHHAGCGHAAAGRAADARRGGGAGHEGHPQRRGGGGGPRALGGARAGGQLRLLRHPARRADHRLRHAALARLGAQAGALRDGDRSRGWCCPSTSWRTSPSPTAATRRATTTGASWAWCGWSTRCPSRSTCRS